MSEVPADPRSASRMYQTTQPPSALVCPTEDSGSHLPAITEKETSSKKSAWRFKFLPPVLASGAEANEIRRKCHESETFNMSQLSVCFYQS